VSDVLLNFGDKRVNRTEGMRSTATCILGMRWERRKKGRWAGSRGCEVASGSSYGSGRWTGNLGGYEGTDESDGGDRGKIEMNQLI
jgi:hypothetical protein